jgi:hypothetical protein
MSEYFSKFPITAYKGVPSLNILKRTGFNENVREFLTSFYTYTIEEGYRIDSLAHDYYDSVNYDWLIYQTNDIVDPYYQIPLNSFEFESYIRKKYGSIREATRKTAFFANNFEGDDTIESLASYDAKPAAQKKYWRPVVNALGAIGYERSDEDFTATTNKIISLQLLESDQSFEVGEIVEKVGDPSSFAEVVWSDETGLVIQHIRGSFDEGDVLKGEQSKVEKTIEDVLLVQDVIPELEQVFYKPVSFYDVEVERNEQNAEVYLVDKSNLQQIDRQLTNLLK